MALIEIDVEPMTFSAPAEWTVKITPRDPASAPMKQVKGLVTCEDALNVVRQYMEDRQYF